MLGGRQRFGGPTIGTCRIGVPSGWCDTALLTGSYYRPRRVGYYGYPRWRRAYYPYRYGYYGRPYGYYRPVRHYGGYGYGYPYYGYGRPYGGVAISVGLGKIFDGRATGAAALFGEELPLPT
jgi:hypothetical protein